MGEKTRFHMYLIIDAIDFTSQLAHDEKKKIEEIESFRNHVDQICSKHGFKLREKPGDAAVLVGGDKGEGLLALVRELFEGHSDYDYHFALRAVAHGSHLRIREDKICFDNLEVIRAFRMEKKARKWELLVSDPIRESIRFCLDGIDVSPAIDDANLKGLENVRQNISFYRLRFPIERDEVAFHPEYVRKRNAFYVEVSEIPVFGGLFNPISMKDNFLNLSLEAKYDEQKKTTVEFSANQEYRFGGRLEGEDDELQSVGNIKAKELISQFNKGLILGLPGAGKTTILKHIAFVVLSESQAPALLWIKCSELIEENYQYCFGLSHSNLSSVMRFFVGGFLFPGLLLSDLKREDLVILDEMVKDFERAFDAQKATILIDALDETVNKELRQKILEIYFDLSAETSHLKVKDQPSNQIFLTSRPAEFSYSSTADCPIFYVNALDQGHIVDMARYFFGSNSGIGQRLYEELPKTPYAVKVGGTPLTALLVIIWYSVYQRFELRFGMYDLFLKFVLFRTWEKLKGDGLGKSITEYFDEVGSEAFLEKETELASIYLGLAKLAFDCLFDRDEHQRHAGIDKKVIEKHFAHFIREENPDLSQDESNVLSRRWVADLIKQHLLVTSSAHDYQFIHRTVMEYLAGYAVHQSQHDDQYHRIMATGDSEVLPILASHSTEKAYQVLKLLKGRGIQLYASGELNLVAFRCLAETEATESYELNKEPFNTQKEALNKTYREIGFPLKKSYYEELLTCIQDPEERTHNLKANFKKSMPLCRGILEDEFLTSLTLNAAQRALLRAISSYVWRSEPEPAVVEVAKPKIDAPRVDTPRVEMPEVDRLQSIHPALIHIYGGEGTNEGHQSTIRACDWNQHQQLATVSSDDTARLWDVETHQALEVLRGHDGSVTSCAWDDQRLATVSDDATVRIWGWSDDGGQAMLWGVLRGHEKAVNDCAWLVGRDLLATASSDGTVRIWDVRTGTEAAPPKRHKNRVNACAWRNDGLLATASSDRTVCLWDIESTTPRVTLEDQERAIWDCAWSPGGLLAWVSADHTARIWDADASLTIPLYGHQGSIFGCAWSTDGRLATVAYDHTARVWSATGQELGHIKVDWQMNDVCWDPGGGNRIITANANGSATMFDLDKLPNQAK